MRRALLIGAGTLGGVTAVLAYHPGSWFGTGTAAASSALPATSDTTTATNATTATAATPVAPSEKTITGDAIDTRYGPVQVQIVVKGSQLISATGNQQATDGHSAQIAAYAIPELEQQAVTAQTASISGVSGASYTSSGFAQSLQSALQQAGLA
mgnify:FL=1